MNFSLLNIIKMTFVKYALRLYWQLLSQGHDSDTNGILKPLVTETELFTRLFYSQLSFQS